MLQIYKSTTIEAIDKSKYDVQVERDILETKDKDRELI